jgi:hypothetical protein
MFNKYEHIKTYPKPVNLITWTGGRGERAGDKL